MIEKKLSSSDGRGRLFLSQQDLRNLGVQIGAEVSVRVNGNRIFIYSLQEMERMDDDGTNEISRRRRRVIFGSSFGSKIDKKHRIRVIRRTSK